MALSNRDLIRSKTIGANSTRSSQFVEIEGVKVLIKAPSIRAFEAANRAGGLDPETRVMANPLRWMLEIVIGNSYDPESGQPLFEDGDRESLMNETMTGWLRTLSEKISAMMSEVPKEAAKNSEATPGVASSSI